MVFTRIKIWYYFPKMKKILPRKIVLMIGLLALGAALLIFLALHFFTIVREGRRYPQSKSIGTPASTQYESQPQPYTDTPGAKIRVVPKNNLVIPTIRYRDRRFIPETTTLEQNAKGTGCLIEVLNEGAVPLVIRLSPHELALKGNYGGQYDPVPQGKFIIIDPRFDMGYESFHNFNAPIEEFHVRIGNSCRSDL